MATTLTHKAYESIASLLTTELNSLGNGSYSAASAAQGADGTGGNLYGDFELVLGSLNPTDVGNLAELYIVRAVDGTNYPDAPSSNNVASNDLAGVFVGGFDSAAHRCMLYDIPLPPGLWKVYLKNTSGVSFAASANTVKVRPHNLLNT